MTETLAALILAHTLADFLFQTRWMVENKRRLPAMAAHIATVLVTALATTGSLHPALLALAAAHLGIDLCKTFAPPRLVPSRLALFLGDQAAHLATLVAVAVWVPDLWGTGLWATMPGATNAGSAPLPGLMAIAAGAILTTRAGGFAMILLMQPWADASPRGLPNGGRAIGHLERGMIFLLVLSGQAEGIGFLIAAKSVLRFGTVGDDRAVSEYVIIGTLASFGWAIAVSLGTMLLLNQLPDLGIPDLTP